MKNDIINFDINEKQRIEIILPCEIKDLCSYRTAKIYLYNNKKKYLIFNNYYYNPLYNALDDLKRVIKVVLKGFSDEKAVNNIGYLWNEYLADRPNKNLKMVNKKDYWIGEKYYVWEHKKTTTWLYNNKGEFIIEITPTYKWHFEDPKENEKYITYNKYIKTYKTILKVKVSKENLKDWVKQINKIVKIMIFNDKLEKHCSI